MDYLKFSALIHYHSTRTNPEGINVIIGTFFGETYDNEAARHRGGIFISQQRPDLTSYTNAVLGSLH